METLTAAEFRSKLHFSRKESSASKRVTFHALIIPEGIKQKFHSVFGDPRLFPMKLVMPCGCGTCYTKELPEESVQCEHGNYFVRYL